MSVLRLRRDGLNSHSPLFRVCECVCCSDLLRGHAFAIVTDGFLQWGLELRLRIPVRQSCRLIPYNASRGGVGPAPHWHPTRSHPTICLKCLLNPWPCSPLLVPPPSRSHSLTELRPWIFHGHTMHIARTACTTKVQHERIRAPRRPCDAEAWRISGRNGNVRSAPPLHKSQATCGNSR
jgi:hypothetical protein